MPQKIPTNKPRTALLTALALLALLIFNSCGEDNTTDSLSGEWLVPVDEVLDGGPGKDGIPALSNPQMIDIASATFMRDTSLIIAVKVGSEVRGYPHMILDWHEIANDRIAASAFALTYCPLTGTAIGWSRVINGTETTFGVSGLLYQTNLMPYDRMTNSTWSQMLNKSVNGSQIGNSAETFQVVETEWKTFQQLFPTAKVMSTNTGVSRPYGGYPYGDYRTNQNRLLFPVSNWDSRLPGKERVVGVELSGASKVYRFSDFGNGVSVINDSFNGVDLIAVGSADKNFGMVFGRALPGGPTLTFTALQNQFPAVMVDNEGTTWDLFGAAISGPRVGEKLPLQTSYIAYWFAWGAFHPNAVIHGQ